MKSGKDSFKKGKLPEIVSKIGSPFKNKKEELDSGYFDSGFEIEIEKGTDEGLTFPLDMKEMRLGRVGSPDEIQKGIIPFSDPSVSRVHAVLRWDKDLDKYVIYHLSKTTPTLVNGRAVKKSLLSADYTVQLGELVFRVISIKEKRHHESTMMWERFKAGEERGDELVKSGYKLVVVEGPDKGDSFELDKNLMIIGRRKGLGDIRDTFGILLSDEKLPEELALLVWNKEEKKYAVYQSEESPVPIRLFRVVETSEGSRIVGREFQNILEDRDSIMAENTVLVVHRSTDKETRDAKLDIEKELQEEALAPAPVAVPSMTAPGSFRIDYVFEIIDGPGKGQKISLLSDEMTEGRIIAFGSSGEARQNDIELEDKSLSNTQGYLEFNEGNLYLINESRVIKIMVNEYEINENEKIVLNGGDRIIMGKTVLEFTDNRVIAALSNYSLSILSGEDDDKARHYPLVKTSMIIGRGSASDVRVFDPEVSRLHAVLYFKSGRFHLEHKSKINPTFVNGVSLKRGQDRIIFPGDKIYLSGNTILQLARK